MKAVVGRKPRLSVAEAAELARLVKLRRELTDAALAKRFGLSCSGVQFYARGLHKLGPAKRAALRA